MAKRKPFLQVGDIVRLEAGMTVYTDVPAKYVFTNVLKDDTPRNTEVVIGGESTIKRNGVKFKYPTPGEYLVYAARSEGGGTGHGPHDVYPDGWHVSLKKLNKQGGFTVKGVEVDFYQSGSFTAMIEPEQVQPHARMTREVRFTNRVELKGASHGKKQK